MSEIKPDVESIIKYLESFIEFCDCGNPKADCICIDKNGWETSREYKLETQLKDANNVIDFYAKKRNLGTITKEISDIYWLENGEKAREYKEKYRNKQ